MVLHWTRPARLRPQRPMAARTARFLKRMPAGDAADGRRHPPHRDPACAAGNQSGQNRTPCLPCLAQRRTDQCQILCDSVLHAAPRVTSDATNRCCAPWRLGHDIEILANRRDTIGSGIDPEHLWPILPQIRWSWRTFVRTRGPSWPPRFVYGSTTRVLRAAVHRRAASAPARR